MNEKSKKTGVALPMLVLWVIGVPLAAFLLARARVAQAVQKVAVHSRSPSSTTLTADRAKAKRENLRVATHQAREAVSNSLLYHTLSKSKKYDLFTLFPSLVLCSLSLFPGTK
jgi:ornithine cyclodeaminase/alanine dehydrogenase-like protein (mu-crystallin family)